VLEKDDSPASVQSKSLVSALLARCAAESVDTQEQLILAQAAATNNDTASLLRLAGIYFNNGRLSEAKDTYQRVLERSPALPEAILNYVRIQLYYLSNPVLSTDEERRSGWARLDALLDRLKDPKPWEAYVLKTELRYAQKTEKKIDEARQVIKDATAILPKEIALWAEWASLEMRQNKYTAADQILLAAKTRIGDSADLRLTEFRFSFYREDLDKKVLEEKRGRVLAGLTTNLQSFTKQDQLRLWIAQAEGYDLLGRTEEAAVAIDEILRLKPNDLRWWLARYDNAERLKDGKMVKKSLEEIKRLDGEKGAFTSYIAAYRIFSEVVNNKTPKAEMGKALSPALNHIDETLQSRRKWGKALKLRAQILAAAGKDSEAITAYRAAFDNGEQSFDVLRVLFDHYSQANRPDEVQTIVQQMIQQGSVNTRMSKSFAETFLRAPDFNRALEMGRQAVAQNSTDAADWIWLASLTEVAVQATKGKFDEVEEYYKKATAFAKGEPGPYLARIAFYIRLGRPEEAKKVLQEVATLPPEQHLRILPQGYDLLKDKDRAQAEYLRATKELKDAQTNLNAARFFTNNTNTKEAIGQYQAVLANTNAKPKDRMEARRELAVILATFGRTGEADTLLKQNEKEDQANIAADRRARALIFARSKYTYRDAITLLKKNVLSATDLKLLAQMSLVIGNKVEFEGAMKALTAAEPKNRDHKILWIEELIKQGELANAQAVWGTLQELDRTGFETQRLLGLLNFYAKRSEVAFSVLTGIKPTTEREFSRLASTFEEIRKHDAAETNFREYAKISGKPQASLALARFLGRRSQYDQALDLCETIVQTNKEIQADVVLTFAIDILRRGTEPPTAKQIARLEPWLDKATFAMPQLWQKDWLKGEIADLRADYRTAESHFLQALQKQPNQPVVIASLARLLILSNVGNSENPLKLLETAIAQKPEILDELWELQGLALLKEGRKAEAITVFATADKELPTWRTAFYLAHAYQQAGDTKAALVAWKNATDRGLQPTHLHPLEKALLQDLTTKLTNVAKTIK
jgi:tetratricopeptide (TPR) repeat protein